MNKLTVGDVEVTMTDKGVIWSRKSNGSSFVMRESEIIPIVNVTASLYEAVLKSQLDNMK